MVMCSLPHLTLVPESLECGYRKRRSFVDYIIIRFVVRYRLAVFESAKNAHTMFRFAVAPANVRTIPPPVYTRHDQEAFGQLACS